MSTPVPKPPTLKPIDLSKITKKPGGSGECFHPDVDTKKRYLGKVGGTWYTGSFVDCWYGHNFNVGMHGFQLDKPGTNMSSWEELYEIVPYKRKTKRERKSK